MDIKGKGWEFGYLTGKGGGWGRAGLFLDGKFVLGSGACWDGAYEGPDEEMERRILAALAGKEKTK